MSLSVINTDKMTLFTTTGVLGSHPLPSLTEMDRVRLSQLWRAKRRIALRTIPDGSAVFRALSLAFTPIFPITAAPLDPGRELNGRSISVHARKACDR
jgi:hypothetical protein